MFVRWNGEAECFDGGASQSLYTWTAIAPRVTFNQQCPMNSYISSRLYTFWLPSCSLPALAESSPAVIPSFLGANSWRDNTFPMSWMCGKVYSGSHVILNLVPIPVGEIYNFRERRPQDQSQMDQQRPRIVMWRLTAGPSTWRRILERVGRFEKKHKAKATSTQLWIASGDTDLRAESLAGGSVNGSKIGSIYFVVYFNEKHSHHTIYNDILLAISWVVPFVFPLLTVENLKL